MIKRLLVASALLSSVMVGCEKAAIGSFGADVLNTVTENHPESCAGGLKTLIRLSNVEIYNKVVAAGEEDRTNTGTAQMPNGYELVYQGAPVVVEAWCFGTGGTEVGYAKKQGGLNVYMRDDAALVTPAIPGRTECLADVRRGDFPCIQSFAVE